MTRNETRPPERSTSGSTGRSKHDRNRSVSAKADKSKRSAQAPPPAPLELEPQPQWTLALGFSMVGLVAMALTAVIALVVLGQELKFAAGVVLFVVLAIIWRLLPSTRARHHERKRGPGWLLYQLLHLIYGNVR
ncbi:hypothetical protein [Nocardia fluminea]|uniref:hypothetical protein n=1 Tax=Nocardia fluminea TaxID=134984 RepID=UPI0037BA9294